MKFTAVPLVDRIAEKFELTDDGCWTWTASTREGYGQIRVGGSVIGAHRAAYLEVVGEIGEDLDLDHLCRNRLCVNPDHLEVVTRRENILRGTAPPAINARKTHCDYGHKLGPARPGGRPCMPCRRRRRRQGD